MKERPSLLTRLRSEPLWLFLLLGSLVFVLDRVTPDAVEPSEYRIDLSTEQIERIRAVWLAQTNRLPSQQEMNALVEDTVREEILFREALRLGLDKDDVIVRRRMAQKMGFFLEDASASVTPSESDLREFFDAHVDRYRSPERFSFSHIYLSRDVRGDSTRADAERILTSLEDPANATDWRRLGDPFMLLREYAERSEQEIVELFGGTFARTVRDLPIGSWQGPVESAYGLHLVKVEARIAPREPVFEQLRSTVEEDYITEQRRLANENYYRKLRDRYEITIEGRSLQGET